MKKLVFSLMAALAAAPASRAQDEKSDNDPRYEAAVGRAAEALKSLPSYAVDVIVDWKTGDGASGSNAYTFLLERPGKFRVEVKPDPKAEPNLVVVSDGKLVTTSLPAKKMYQQAPLLDPSRGLENNPILATSLKGSLIDSLMKPDLKEYVLARSRRAVLVGTEDLDGRKVDHFRLFWGRDEEDYWLGPEAQTLPRKLVRVYHFPGQDEAGLTLTTTATLQWTVGPPIDPSAFAIALPEGAKKVEDIEAALTDGTTDALVGRAAPDLALPKLGGGEAKLGDAKGKDVVVLNFWASWCGPSVSALPGVAKLQDDAKAKGVRVVSINVGETPARAAAFLAKQAYKLDVLMDPDGLAIERYGVTALPVLVVIDKGGTVRAVHSGGGEALVPGVLADVEAILAGKPTGGEPAGP